MNFIVKILTFLSAYTKRTGICIHVGLISGALAGLSLALLDLIHGGISLTLEEALYMASVLTIFTWLVNVFLLCMLARFTFASVALPALFNCLLTCFATVLITRIFEAYAFAWFIGIIVGMLIGKLLCWINNFFHKINQ